LFAHGEAQYAINFRAHARLAQGSSIVFSGLICDVVPVLGQSMITTYVGPQLPVSGNPALNQAIDVPSAVVPDDAGGLYVVSTDHNRVYEVAADGTLTLVAGSSYGFSGDGGPDHDARLASGAR
jgi:hypothetical protein